MNATASKASRIPRTCRKAHLVSLNDSRTTRSTTIPSSAISSSPSTAPAETSSPTAAPENTTGNSVESQPRAAVPHEQSQNGELSPQDFSSLEDYAKALIEKKQS